MNYISNTMPNMNFVFKIHIETGEDFENVIVTGKAKFN
jgi:hypothetical protein